MTQYGVRLTSPCHAASDGGRSRALAEQYCAPLSASSLFEEVSWRGGLAVGVLRGAVDEPPGLERPPLVAAGTRPAGGDGVEARRQFVGGCLVVDPPAPEMRPGLLRSPL